MDGLRWLLLLFGLLVVAGVYLFSRYQSGRVEKTNPESTSSNVRVEPSLDSVSVDVDQTRDAESESPETGAESEAETSDTPPEQKIVTVRIVAAKNSSFRGDELVLSLRGIGMRHGKFGIFHRFEGSDEDKVIFSAASLVEPGSFDLANIKEQQIPGISLFMVLPGPMEGAQAFDLMMVASRAIAQSLHAELLDESGSTLSIQRERYMREEIIQFEHSNLVV